VFVALFALRMRGEQMCFQKRGDPPGCMGPDDYLRRLGQWLGRAASEPGDLDGQDPAQAACVLMGITHGFFLRWLMAAERREERLADGTERILDVFFYGFSGQPGPVLARSDFSKGTFVAPRERRSRARRPA
jgi:hypothetical protein